MRTIQLTHEEIETIKIALQYVYDTKLDMLKLNKKTLGVKTTSKILEVANKQIEMLMIQYL